MWQPIETAPKDGTAILLAIAGYRACLGQWVDTPRGGKFVAAEMDDFASFEDWGNYIEAHDYNPTHWMPLPPSPQPL